MIDRNSRQARRALERANAQRSATLTDVPRDQWPSVDPTSGRMRVLVSQHYLVQVFDEGNDIQRVSVNRTTLNANGRWVDDMSWDELQSIKQEIGLGNKYAVEVYPPEADVVNAANMRHLWVMPCPLPIGWKNRERTS